MKVTCTLCERTYSVADSLAGKTIRCRFCSEDIAVPKNYRKDGLIWSMLIVFLTWMGSGLLVAALGASERWDGPPVIVVMGCQELAVLMATICCAVGFKLKTNAIIILLLFGVLVTGSCAFAWFSNLLSSGRPSGNDIIVG